MSHLYPHFLIVGFMKSGTTTVFHHITSHPGVQEPKKKELHYFTREYVADYDETLFGFEYSEQLNYDEKSEKLCGEASPSYIVAADRVAAFNPNAKIIFLLRDPVDRALSQFRWYREHNALSHLESILADQNIEEWPIVRDSTFAPYLSSYLERFSARNVLLVSFEEFKKSQNEAMKSIFQFLKLVPMAVVENKVLSASNDSYEHPGLRERLEAFFSDKRGKVAELVTKFGPCTFPKDASSFQRY